MSRDESTQLNTLAIVIPIYNENLFAVELIRSLYQIANPRYIVAVDDASTDSTLDLLIDLSTELMSEEFTLIVLSNTLNVGHGATLMRGLNHSLTLPVGIIATADGDGNFSFVDFAKLLNKFMYSDALVGEGIRVNRGDPWFRRLVSMGTNVLLYLKTFEFAYDANTPFRFYRKETLRFLMSDIPDHGHAIPNMHFSRISRQRKFPVFQDKISITKRNFAHPLGVTWNQKYKFFPSMRFLKFCFNSFLSWILMD